MNPELGSRFAVNINTEMNYWCAESCNLSECHEPLFDLIEKNKGNPDVLLPVKCTAVPDMYVITILICGEILLRRIRVKSVNNMAVGSRMALPAYI